MAGIYIHIPFCKQACYYCDFYFSTSSRYRGEMVAALLKEMELRQNYLYNEQISSIYFGGGTPSLLEEGEIALLLDKINKLFTVSPDAEITLEANPDDLTVEKIAALRRTSVNRLSIGVQSFRDADLLWMNRAHNSAQASDSIKAAQDAGFHNLSIDLIYGTPTLTDEGWANNLETTLGLQLPHISSYCLTVEPKTALHKMIKTGKYPDVNEETAVAHFVMMTEKLQLGGFEQYEISNFCRDGKYSRHNSNYWKGEKYLGLGPSAHSYDGESRQWNIADNKTYIHSVEEGKPQFEKEQLSPLKKYNEYILTTLRTIWGCDLGYIERTFGTELSAHIQIGLEKWISDGMVVRRGAENEKAFLTPKGKLYADRIASDLFIVE